MKAELGPPTRLAELPGPAGDCVRAARAQRELDAEPPAFSALRERRVTRTQRQLASAAFALAGVAVLALRLLSTEEAAPSVRAETFVPSPAPSESGLARSESAPPTPADSTALPALPFKAKPALRAMPKPVATHVEPAPLAPPTGATVGDPAPPSGSAKACAELARRGPTAAALSCYERLAGGSGMTAELALFERARLEGKALRRPDLALKTLDAYRQRFPNGSLRPEVMLARIDWLVRSGEPARALQAVDEALASGLLRERTAELTRLRDSLDAPPLDRPR